MKYSVIITSDRITEETDKSGKLLVELLGDNHTLKEKIFSKNNVEEIRSKIEGLKNNENEFIFCLGGTGISRKDMTINAVSPLIEKEVPGFAELFRSLSVKEIGTRAMLSRALLGISDNGVVICCLPGSPNAVKLAMTQILSKEIPHIISELRK